MRSGRRIKKRVASDKWQVTHHTSRFPFYVLILLLLITIPATAQTQSPSYWQYRAAGRLQHVITADLNGDSFDEFVVVDEDGKVDILDADGVWQNSYTAAAPVAAIQTVDTDDARRSPREIVLGYPNRLVLLAANGSELWQTPLTALATPPDLLAGSSRAAELAWQAQYDAIPTAIESFDWDGDGRSEILVLLNSGQLQLLDGNGNLIWRYVRGSNPAIEIQPFMTVADFNQDGQDEVALGYFTPALRFSQLALIDRNGRLLWDQEQPISGRLTALTTANLAGRSYIALANNLGHLYAYDSNRQRFWFRTINRPITTLTPVSLSDGPGIAVGTDGGSIIVYNWEGQRQWTRHLSPNAQRRIIGLSAAPPLTPDDQPFLAAVIEGAADSATPADVVLLSQNGRSLNTLEAVDDSGLVWLLDINHDQHTELLLARFSNLELLGFGIGVSQLASDWEYDLLGLPRSMLVVDFDQDGEDELLVGTENGRIHRLNNDGTFPWVVNPGVAITHLAALPNPATNTPDVVVVRSSQQSQSDAGGAAQSWLAVRQANGEQIWEESLPTTITAVQIGNLNINSSPEIAVGTADGDVIVLNNASNILWQTQLPEPVTQLLIVRDSLTQSPAIVAATTHRLYLVNSNHVPWIMAVYDTPIQAVYPINQSGNGLSGLIVFAAEGQVFATSLLGRPAAQWPFTIDGPLQHTLYAAQLLAEEPLPKPAADSFLVTTAGGTLRNLLIEEGQPRLSWLLTGLGNITSLHWGDLDNNGVPDMILGDSNGRVSLYEANPNLRQPELKNRLNLGSSVFGLSILQRENRQTADLLTITQNGVVQLFRGQENLPPLLTKPQAEIIQGRYSLAISVRDAERDNVVVGLETFNPESQTWERQEEQQLIGGNGGLFWILNTLPANPAGVQYRFQYNDGFHQGRVTPPSGPPPPSPVINNNSLTGLIVLGISGLVFTLFFLRQAQAPAAQARRFYHVLQQTPDLTLLQMEARYRRNRGSPDFLLALASHARQRGDNYVASLSDGLFLLDGQLRAGLPIIIHTLQDALKYAHPPWQCLDRWRRTFEVSRALLEAPSVTELSLLHPELEQLLALFEKAAYWSPTWELLPPILTNLRDSKRVNLAEDSLVYLNEAAIFLNEFGENTAEIPFSIDQPLVEAIVMRWTGLVSAEIEALRGRADLAITLKTKRIAPSEQTDVVLEIQNNGRAPAENLIVALAENPAYIWNGRPSIIPIIPPGRSRQVSFIIEPAVKDRFRLALNLTYDDRNQRGKSLAFGDMVHLLPPVREFRPIANPYLPGTPLRPNSTIFFGRNDLFAFIAESAERVAQHNVLILVGQRRTGKTSILLRLEQHLPANLLPVYIDCQSLGVTPGMPALLYDLAWHIADALAARSINLDVPEPELWQEDPTRHFQRRFLPHVQSLLPPGTTLLLVFDEFEAFENLVQDKILPPTLFPYLRHLMQHSEGLSFVFVGTRRLEEMSADYWSVLFNIALYQKIGYLRDAVAKQLIEEPVAPNLVYDDLAIDKILRVTAGHPYFLQLVCYTLVKQANKLHKSYVTISDVNAALDEMLSLGEVHFAYLWQRSTYGEKALLTAVSHLMDQDMSFHPGDMVQYLEPYGIHLTPADVTSALKSLVERDILQEVTEGTTALYELKIGLVGLWVARQKSLSHLYSSNGEAVKRSQHV
jgi:outer membrane protein assembly factor BamB